MSGTQENQKSESVRNVNQSTGIKKKNLTQEKLKEMLNYDHITGLFAWNGEPRRGVKIGGVAGSAVSSGHIKICIGGKQYYAHRLAWLYMEGYFPEIGIDHKDMDPSNNIFSNLRLASKQCNARNTGSMKNSTSGIKGVTWDKKNGKWKAQIAVNRKTKNLGRYKDFHDAVCARLAGEQCLNWTGCDSNSPSFQYVNEMIKKRAEYKKSH